MREEFRFLASRVVNDLQQRCKKSATLEACGLLLARPGETVLEGYTEYLGALKQREFCLPQDWLLSNFLKERSRGYRIAGFYHTHPEGMSLEPSPADISGHPPGSLVLVIGAEDWRAFRAFQPCWKRLHLTLVD